MNNIEKLEQFVRCQTECLGTMIDLYLSKMTKEELDNFVLSDISKSEQDILESYCWIFTQCRHVNSIRYCYKFLYFGSLILYRVK